MNRRRFAALPALLSAALLVVGCSDGVSPGGAEFWLVPPPPPPPPERARELVFTIEPAGAEAQLACVANPLDGDVITVEVMVQFVDDPGTPDVNFAGPVELRIEDDASLLDANLCGPLGGTDVLTALASGGFASFTFGIDQPSSRSDPTDPGSPELLYTVRASAGLGITDAISQGFCVSLLGVPCDV